MPQSVPELEPEKAHARAAGLSYVSDTGPGIRRKAAGTGYSYRDPDGGAISDKDTLKRVRSLAVPPAWTDVWICPRPTGHIQATVGMRVAVSSTTIMRTGGAAGPRQVRTHPGLRAGSAAYPRARCQGHGQARRPAREGSGDRRVACSTRPLFVSATTSMPRTTVATASPLCGRGIWPSRALSCGSTSRARAGRRGACT